MTEAATHRVWALRGVLVSMTATLGVVANEASEIRTCSSYRSLYKAKKKKKKKKKKKTKETRGKLTKKKEKERKNRRKTEQRKKELKRRNRGTLRYDRARCIDRCPAKTKKREER